MFSFRSQLDLDMYRHFINQYRVYINWWSFLLFVESRNSSEVSTTPSYVWDEPCHWHNIITSNFERSVNYTLQSGEYEECYDWEIHMEGWYKFSGNESIPTNPAKPGQCGSSYPIWLEGEYTIFVDDIYLNFIWQRNV